MAGAALQSLSAIARAITGTRWNGWVFFGLKNHRGVSGGRRKRADDPVDRSQPRTPGAQAEGRETMTKPPEKSKVVRKLRCAIYTRKSSEEGLEQEFNSLHAQREACEAYIASQRSEGWVAGPRSV